MCYSASVSFAASAVLTTMGVFLLFRKQNNRFWPFALIPLFFAIQQAAEGFLWLDTAPNLAKNLFLFFAFIIWPLWIPFAFWFAEKKTWSKQVLALCFGVGLVVSSLLALAIPNMIATTDHASIQYLYPPHFYKPGILFIFYSLATLIPFFLSSLPKTTLLGLLFAIAALLALWIDKTFFISLWCFFSALISLGFFFIKENFSV